jgi:hypothetical protein
MRRDLSITLLVPRSKPTFDAAENAEATHEHEHVTARHEQDRRYGRHELFH